MDETISMLHGSGGAATGRLIDEVFAGAFSNPVLDAMEDAAVVAGDGRIAVTTDSFVVTPLCYPGGDIGRLCVCGTVNDLLMRGAVPKYLTCGFILEEGLLAATLKKVVASMAETAKEAGVTIICGDTKVVEGSGGMYINTTGIGFVPAGCDISAANAKDGDMILLSGTLGEHHATILSQRLAVDNDIQSDNAPLVEIAEALGRFQVHTLRDVTRGGLATVLCELAKASGTNFILDSQKIPVADKVRDFCGILGLDPLYMGNEGKLVAIVAKEDASAALAAVRGCRYGADAAIIGEVRGVDNKVVANGRLPDADGTGLSAVSLPQNEAPGRVYMRTAIGGLRRIMELQDEGLPRIC